MMLKDKFQWSEVNRVKTMPDLRLFEGVYTLPFSTFKPISYHAPPHGVYTRTCVHINIMHIAIHIPGVATHG